MRIGLKDEKLVTFFYDCGLLGHDNTQCETKNNLVPFKNGPWPRSSSLESATAPRTLDLDSFPQNPQLIAAANQFQLEILCQITGGSPPLIEDD